MFELWRLTRRMDTVNRRYTKLIETARREKRPKEEIELLNHEAGFEIGLLEEQVREVVTRELTSKAARMLLEVPPRNDDSGLWELSQSLPSWRLTDKGIAQLRRTIREEQRVRREARIVWVGLVIGVIGAVTGLVAVVMNR